MIMQVLIKSMCKFCRRWTLFVLNYTFLKCAVPGLFSVYFQTIFRITVDLCSIQTRTVEVEGQAR